MNEGGARIETESGIAGDSVLQGAAKIESIAPRALVVGRTSRNKRFVVVNEAVAEIGKQAPVAESAPKFEAGEPFLCSSVMAVRTRTWE